MPSERTKELLKDAPPIGPAGYDPWWDGIDETRVNINGKLIPVGIKHYDREGEPITMRQWTQLRHLHPDYYRVASDEVGAYHVSTVWLGIDHGFGNSRPVIFETMVFASELSYSEASEPFTDEMTGVEFPGFPEYTYHEDFDQRRYYTEEQALAGHAELCEQIRLIMAATGDIDPRIEGEEGDRSGKGAWGSGPG